MPEHFLVKLLHIFLYVGCNVSSLYDIQGDQKVSVHLMITVQTTRKNILNSFNHLP
jgi:hypothetical protein